tara:strand:+ start:817 stop:1041 length:225 start_codon:yes stop_codon:yes gene_type:complete
MNSKNFEYIGYHLEYYSDNKYLGSIKFQNYNGICGYGSRKKYIANESLIIGKKKIKKGQKYITQVIPICGKLIK